MQLPTFRYHPDPVRTGNVIVSNEKCLVCGKTPGLIYVGPVYAVEEYDGRICPWCIADGTAHEKLDCTFTDEAGVGGYGKWDSVPESAVDEIVCRTPGFAGWQQEKWWTHCHDAAKFLGRVGKDELERLGPEAAEAIRVCSDIPDVDQWLHILGQLRKEEPPSAYLFQCTKCGKLGGYWDTC